MKKMDRREFMKFMGKMIYSGSILIAAGYFEPFTGLDTKKVNNLFKPRKIKLERGPY